MIIYCIIWYIVNPMAELRSIDLVLYGSYIDAFRQGNTAADLLATLWSFLISLLFKIAITCSILLPLF